MLFRSRKNDIIDSLLIADLIRYGQFVETRLADEDLFSLRTLTRQELKKRSFWQQ